MLEDLHLREYCHEQQHARRESKESKDTARSISQDGSFSPPFPEGAGDVSRLCLPSVPLNLERTTGLKTDSLYQLRQLLEEQIYRNGCSLQLLRTLYVTDLFGAHNWVLIAVCSFCGPVFTSRMKYGQYSCNGYNEIHV